MKILKILLRAFSDSIKVSINFIVKIIVYCTKRNPVLATGVIGFFFAFTIVACNALFVQETKADGINTRTIEVTNPNLHRKIEAVSSNEPKATSAVSAVKPKHKLNNYATKKTLHTVLKLSRRVVKKTLRKNKKYKKLH